MNAITPLQRWRHDDWVIPCTLRDGAGIALNLTGFTLAAEFWLPGYNFGQPLTVANGGIVRVSDANGRFKVVVSRLLTARALGDAAIANPAARARVLIYWIDPYGQRQTLGLVPFTVFDGSEGIAIDGVPEVVLVSENTSFQITVAASQGAAGPSNIPAAQISDGGELGRQVLQAADAAAARQLLGVAAFTRAAVADLNYAIKRTDTYVGVTALTAPRTLTLPAAADYPPGQPLYVADESGQCSTDNRILIMPAGADILAGQGSGFFLASPYLRAVFHSNGTDRWIS